MDSKVDQIGLNLTGIPPKGKQAEAIDADKQEGKIKHGNLINDYPGSHIMVCRGCK